MTDEPRNDDAAEAEAKAEEAKAAAEEAAAKAQEAAAAADEASQAAAAAETPKPKAKAKPQAAAKPAAAEPAAEAPGDATAEAPVDDKPAEKPKAKPKGKAKAKAAPAKPAPTRRRRRPGDELVIVRAQARYVRSSARKARLVADGVRGKSVAEARAKLQFHPRQVSEAWTKLLESAVANAENNHDLVGEEMRIFSVHADEGPTLKRFRPRAMGRATRIRKRTSHLSITLISKES
jgi:ribosomal protein L22